MRKLSALFIVILAFFPLAVAAMTLTAIRPWVLDRGFYERLASDERLYEALLTDELPRQLNQEQFIADEQLPVDALSIALREVVTLDYLRGQALNVIGEVFDYIEGHDQNFELTLDFTPIKIALYGKGGLRFAEALASALPPCAVGQQVIAPNGSLTRCIASEALRDSAVQQIAAALPALLENTPDRIVLNDRVHLRTNWYTFDWLLGTSVRAALDLAMLMTVLFAVGAGCVGAYLGGHDLRGRLQWLSSSLFAPGSLFVFFGLIVTSPYIVGPIGNSIALQRYSEAFREAELKVIVQVIQQIGAGLVLTGGVVCLVALGLLIWSWVTPAKGRDNPKLVQIPIRNP